MQLSDMQIAVVGLGYVGLPLAVEFGRKRSVVGFDINESRIKELENYQDNTLETTQKELKDAIYLSYSSNLEDIKDCKIYIITVPTPIDNQKKPDLSPLKNASQSIGSILKKGDIVIYESTVYPGATEEICVPILEEQSSLSFNKDFYCGYSPERINPGDKEHRITTIKKITSGSTPEIAALVDKLYKEIISAGTHKASSIKVAEAAKVIENTQRDVNIALINELSVIFNKLDIDTESVLEAASTKWNFLPFKPGLVGGHCIGVDPYYLTYKAKKIGYSPDVILSGRTVNENMAQFVTDKLVRGMKKRGLEIDKSNILILGITYKENCPDTRNTKIPEVYNNLKKLGANVNIFDPCADFLKVKSEYEIDLINGFAKYDGIILAVSHNYFKGLNYDKLKKNSNSFILDIKSFLNKKVVDARL